MPIDIPNFEPAGSITNPILLEDDENPFINWNRETSRSPTLFQVLHGRRTPPLPQPIPLVARLPLDTVNANVNTLGNLSLNSTKRPRE